MKWIFFLQFVRGIAGVNGLGITVSFSGVGTGTVQRVTVHSADCEARLRRRAGVGVSGSGGRGRGARSSRYIDTDMRWSFDGWRYLHSQDAHRRHPNAPVSRHTRPPLSRYM